MPGGKNYRQWYAVRAKLQAEGRWGGGDGPETRQQTLDEMWGPKRPRVEDAGEEMPPLEGEEGDPDKDNYAGKLTNILYTAHTDQKNQQSQTPQWMMEQERANNNSPDTRAAAAAAAGMAPGVEGWFQPGDPIRQAQDLLSRALLSSSGYTGDPQTMHQMLSSCKTHYSCSRGAGELRATLSVTMPDIPGGLSTSPSFTPATAPACAFSGACTPRITSGSGEGVPILFLPKESDISPSATGGPWKNPTPGIRKGKFPKQRKQRRPSGGSREEPSSLVVVPGPDPPPYQPPGPSGPSTRRMQRQYSYAEPREDDDSMQ